MQQAAHLLLILQAIRDAEALVHPGLEHALGHYRILIGTHAVSMDRFHSLSSDLVLRRSTLSAC
jgi:hypothetical protein